MRHLGPGILLAGAAIGGSHLVASTQAGAHYGWSLLGILILINLFKYPFFRYGQRYTAATGETLLEGYRRLGTTYLVIFFLMNVITGLINIAGVAMLSGSLATNFGFGHLGIPTISFVLLLACALIIIIGGFNILLRVGRVVVAVLALSTLVAMVISVYNGPVAEAGFVGDSPWTDASFGFVIMFMGWMPAPIEGSVWPSVWMKSRERLQKKVSSMRETMIDFHAGYYTTVLMALVFMVLGRMVMYGTGVQFSSEGPVFARQLIDLYSESIGAWASPLIMIGAFTAMLSTTLTLVDAYPRVLSTSLTLMSERLMPHLRWMHRAWVVISVVISTVIINYFANQLGDMLSLAMILSFLTAPLFALLNYRVMLLGNVPEQYKPRVWEKLLSVSGIVFLIGFGLVFIYWRFF